MTVLKKLCEKYSNLTSKDIQKLNDISQMLQLIADFVRADVFINCLVKDSDVAIVVAEAKPSTGETMYENTVVGELAYRENEPAALRTLKIGIATRDLKAITQENKTVIQNTVPIKNDSNDTIGVLIMEKDITHSIAQSKQMEILSETAVNLSETLLSFKDQENNITRYMNEAIIIFNKNKISTYANPGAISLYQKLGYKDSIIGMSFDNLVLGGISFDKIMVDSTFETREVTVGELCLQTKYAFLKQKDKINGVVMFIKDNTDVMLKEKELILRSVAIKEIHHRVKNNLQTIASLLNLQSRRIDDEMAKKAFGESISRILSIAITHELLAQEGVDDIDIITILTRLKETTAIYSIPPEKDITLNVRGDSILVNSDMATSIALVVNELLQNSVKHGFNGVDKGVINIVVQRGRLYSSISVIDDGVGFNDKYESNSSSLGQKIVEQIVNDKLSGHLTIETSDEGTNTTFDFKH